MSNEKNQKNVLTIKADYGIIFNVENLPAYVPLAQQDRATAF